MVTDGDQTYCNDHFVMYRNIKSLCCAPGTNSVIGQSIKLKKKPKQTHRKRDQICGGQKQGVGEGELDEGGQRVQTSSCKINNYQGYNTHRDQDD